MMPMKHHGANVVAPTRAVRVDPVCGMEVDQDSAPAKVQDKEQIFYFCNPHCAEAFREQPQKYLERRNDSPRFAMNGSE